MELYPCEDQEVFPWLSFFQGVFHPSFFYDIHSMSLIYVQLLLTFIFEKCSCVFQSQNKEGNLRQVIRVRRKLPSVHILHFLLDFFTLCELLSHGHFIRLVSMGVYQNKHIDKLSTQLNVLRMHLVQNV